MTERQIEQQRLHSVLCAHKSAFCCTGELQHIKSARTRLLDMLFRRALFAVQKNRIFNIREGLPSRSLLELFHSPLDLFYPAAFYGRYLTDCTHREGNALSIGNIGGTIKTQRFN